MAKKLFDKVRDFFTAPTKAFQEERKTELKDALVYGAAGLAILMLLIYVMSLIAPEMSGLPWKGLLGLAFVLLAGAASFLAMLVGGLWLHLWAYLFGAREGLVQTIKIVFYAGTPKYYLGWIPFINIAAQVWSWVLLVIGLRELQKLSTGKAIGTFVVAVVIPALIALALLGLAIATLGTDILTQLS